MTLEPLTVDPVKRAAFRADTYYLESAGHLGIRTDDPAGFCRRHAVLLLKPDAVAARRLLPAIDWLAANGFRIVAAERTRLTRHVVRALWYFQWHEATPYRRWLADLFAAATESLVLLVRTERPAVPNAAVLLTELKGPTDPDARRPGQLRHLLGRYSYLLNLVHTADEPADVVRELGVYFDDGILAAVYESAVDGRDRSARARELAGHLHTQVPERDLSFRPAADRVASAAGRLLDRPDLAPAVRADLRDACARVDADPAGHRRLLEVLCTHRLAPDPWDVVVAGSYVLPMKRTPSTADGQPTTQPSHPESRHDPTGLLPDTVRHAGAPYVGRRGVRDRGRPPR